MDQTLNVLQTGRAIYFTSSVVCLALFWLFGGPPMDPGSPVLNNFPLWYEVLPLCFLACVLAVTRRPRGHPGLEIVAAVLWLVTVLGIGLWHPMFRSVESLGPRILDGLAIASGLTAVSMIVLAIQPLASKRARPASKVACSLEVFGMGALGGYLLTISFTLWAATRLFAAGGIDEVFVTARQNVAFVAVVAGILVASTLADRRKPLGRPS